MLTHAKQIKATIHTDHITIIHNQKAILKAITTIREAAPMIKTLALKHLVTYMMRMTLGLVHSQQHNHMLPL